jgi:hypothetical protein
LRTFTFKSLKENYTHLTKSAVDKIKSPLDILVDENKRKKLE